MNAHALLATYALDSHQTDWIPAGPGHSFKPLAFLPGNAGWVQLMRLEPGTLIPRHRHTGEVHALNLEGQRLILGSEQRSHQRIDPLMYVHESAGDVDSWMAVGEQPCVVYVDVRGTVEYLDDEGNVAVAIDAALLRKLYLDWCDANQRRPHPQLVGAPD